MRLLDLFKQLEKYMPLDLAQAWDNCGLQLGSWEAEIDKVALSLDASLETVEMALKEQCQLLLCHHPLFFKPPKNLDLSSPLGAIVQRALAGGLNIISFHTNWDAAQNGVAYALAEKLELGNLKSLEAQSRSFYKLAVYIPKGHVEKIRKAIFAAGAGHIGNYDLCSFNVEGTSTFRVPQTGHPFIGQRGEETTVQEICLTAILPQNKMAAVSRAILNSHPYEEPAFEFSPIHVMAANQGLGLIGHWETARDPRQMLREKLGLKHLKWAGPLKSTVKKVALLPGSGGNYVDLAVKGGAEVLITGDASYHQAQRAQELGLFLIDAGHFETEWPGVEKMAQLVNGCDLEKIILPQKNFWNYEA